jgi:hypothetical protein
MNVVFYPDIAWLPVSAHVISIVRRFSFYFEALIMKVLILCLFFGLTSCTNAQNSNSSVLDNQQSVIQAINKEPLDVSFCELIKSPEKFTARRTSYWTRGA